MKKHKAPDTLPRKRRLDISGRCLHAPFSDFVGKNHLISERRSIHPTLGQNGSSGQNNNNKRTHEKHHARAAAGLSVCVACVAA